MAEVGFVACNSSLDGEAWLPAQPQDLGGSIESTCPEVTGFRRPPEPPMHWSKTLKVEQGEASCLEVSIEFVRQAKANGGDARLLRGLVVDGGRAYPHAWVELRDEHGVPYGLDPTLAIPVTNTSSGGGLDCLEGVRRPPARLGRHRVQLPAPAALGLERKRG
jgi:hypothetical protein